MDRWDGAAPAAARWHVVWIQGEDDAFSPTQRSRAIAGARGWSFVSVPGADHFFAGKLDAFERAAGDALEEALAVP